MANLLYKRCQRAQWLGNRRPSDSNTSLHGVVIRRPSGDSAAIQPQNLNPVISEVAERIGAQVAITMSSDMTDALFEILTPFQTELQLGPGTTIPVVSSIAEIGTPYSTVRPDAYACICRKESLVLLWSASARNIMDHATDVEARLLTLIWGGPINSMAGGRKRSSVKNLWNGATQALRKMSQSFMHQTRKISDSEDSLVSSDATASTLHGPVAQTPAYMLGQGSYSGATMKEKFNIIETAIAKETRGADSFDPEKDGMLPPKRPFLLNHAVSVGIAMALVVIVEMACIAKLLQETRLDGKYLRWALVVTVPLFAAFAMFFMIVIAGSLFQLFGPVSSLSSNSTFYSAIAPKPGRYPDLKLPHVTIQMPVYKEGLQGVIIPTITSIMKAVDYYRARGGTASIFVNDDGMQLVSEDLARARQAFYDVNGIGWAARPAHCEEEGEHYFLRKGQFKKASNMNYCMDFSIRVEDGMNALIDAACKEHGCLRDDLPQHILAEAYNESFRAEVEKDNGRTWAGGDVRIGEVILIIDSDTRVPEDCLIYGALELHESPEVALIQHASGILQVANNMFENGITYFTNLIYTSIQFAVGSGDCAPFVGHNTFIRWKAIQSVAFEEDGMTKFWSDSHVSEDFDISLRLQMAGFVIRLGTYHQGGFKEGVSLTVYDELARWEKYAYGCNELVFHPLIKWPRHGPITPLFRRFLWSNIKITSKITILAYIGTYYAIASAVPLSIANYILEGWFADNIDHYYATSWKIFVGMAVVFNIISPLAYAMLRHRLGQRTFFGSLWETMKWAPMFLLFFGGISFHLCKALFCHFFSIKMEWTTTAKELESSGFRMGLDRVVRDFKGMYLGCIAPCVAGMIFLAVGAPRGWQITDFTLIFPLANQVGCHALLPFALGLF